jgi:hypothetical protein
MKTICVDFDGVIHSYTSGWHGAGRADDPPVPGAIEWLDEMLESDEFEVCVYSSRSSQPDGIPCMARYLVNHGLRNPGIKFPTEKPVAWLTIDDRAIQFNGEFPSLEEMSRFLPWNKK